MMENNFARSFVPVFVATFIAIAVAVPLSVLLVTQLAVGEKVSAQGITTPQVEPVVQYILPANEQQELNSGYNASSCTPQSNNNQSTEDRQEARTSWSKSNRSVHQRIAVSHHKGHGGSYGYMAGNNHYKKYITNKYHQSVNEIINSHNKIYDSYNNNSNQVNVKGDWTQANNNHNVNIKSNNHSKEDNSTVENNHNSHNTATNSFNKDESKVETAVNSYNDEKNEENTVHNTSIKDSILQAGTNNKVSNKTALGVVAAH